MLRHELEGNFTTAQLFRDAPELKYLPAAACERGMYGAFVQGSTQLFFVFGYDKGLILGGDFIEIDGSLYSAQEYFAERRVHIHGISVLRKSFNAYPFSRFHHSASEMACILELMNDLERVMAISTEFGIPMTEYFNYSTTFSSLVWRYYAAADAAPTQRETDHLEDELIWHFKACMMASENPRPEDTGLTLEDYRTSAYCVDRDPRVIEKAFRHPGQWESHLFGYTKDYADNSALSAVYVQGLYAEDLEELLRLHHIPYRFSDPGSVSPKLMRRLAETGIGTTQETWGERLILVYPAMYSMFMQHLMRCALIDIFFSMEEKDEGYRLFQTGQFYGFSIPLTYPVVRFLRSRGIRLYAHESVQLRVLSGYMDAYCFAPLCQKPLVDASLMDYAAQQAYTHDQGCAKFYSASEMRIPEWGGGHHISICDHGYQAGAIVNGQKAEMDYYNLQFEHVPDGMLKERGLLTDPPMLSGYTERHMGEDGPKKPPKEASFTWYKV